MSESEYVLGFHFNIDRSKVLLILKEKGWQRGYLNGIGGKIKETDGSPQMAMAREFAEETNLRSDLYQWRHYVTMYEIKKWRVYCFMSQCCIGSGWEESYSYTSDEGRAFFVDVKSALGGYYGKLFLGNLHWLLSMAVHGTDHNSPVLEIKYVR